MTSMTPLPLRGLPICRARAIPRMLRRALSLRGLGKGFGDKLVLDAIDLDVPVGQFLAVIGKSGCGKSTLLRLISGLDEPTCGVVLHGAGTGARADTRIMFQEPRLLPWARVADNVAVGLTGIVHGAAAGRRVARHPRRGRPRLTGPATGPRPFWRPEATGRAGAGARRRAANPRARRAAGRARRADAHRDAGAAGARLAGPGLHRRAGDPRRRRGRGARRPRGGARSGTHRPRSRRAPPSPAPARRRARSLASRRASWRSFLAKTPPGARRRMTTSSPALRKTDT